MTRATASDAASERPAWYDRDFLAWAAAVIACLVLLAGIHYCPTYEAGKATLIQLWLGTFWNEVSVEAQGLFASQKNTLSGEAAASEWNYCAVVPLITAWLVWQLWPTLRKLPARGDRAGYGILAAGFIFYTLGFLMENNYVGMGSMELVYAGLIVLFFGWKIMKTVLFPWAFLMFMWPYNFLEDVALELRLKMSLLSHLVLEVIQVPNILQGTSIVSAPNAAHSFAIDIADPCSGIRSLFALVMLAAVFAFLACEKFWQRALIVGLAIPLVFVGNLARIVALALATIHFGEGFALGTNTQPSWFHEAAGYLVYLINFGGLILLGSWLARLTAKDKKNGPA